jgi:hypothetical protein
MSRGRCDIWGHRIGEAGVYGYDKLYVIDGDAEVELISRVPLNDI